MKQIFKKLAPKLQKRRHLNVAYVELLQDLQTNMENDLDIKPEITPKSFGGIPEAMPKINMQINSNRMHTNPFWEPNIIENKVPKTMVPCFKNETLF